MQHVTHARCTLPATASSVAAARRFAEQTLGDWGLDAASWTALQLVSELATNALIHAGTAFSIELGRSADELRVGVADGSRATPGVRRYGAESTTGRGLRLIDSMATRWGIDAADDGKVVWFVLDLSGTRTAHTWDDGTEVDLEALLAGFDDGRDDVTASAARGRRASVAA